MKSQIELTFYLKSKGYIKSTAIYDVFCKLDRANFIPQEKRHLAYLDSPLIIGEGQTISAPHMHALCLEELEIDKNKKYKILEIGTGSGYLTALIHLLTPSSTIYSIEKSKQLSYFAYANLLKTGCKVKLFENVNFTPQKGFIHLIIKNGYFGLEEFAPFDRIVVGACYDLFPEFLIKQLDNKKESIAIFPVQEDELQHLIKIKKVSDQVFKTDLGLVSFVYMTNI